MLELIEMIFVNITLILSKRLHITNHYVGSETMHLLIRLSRVITPRLVLYRSNQRILSLSI